MKKFIISTLFIAIAATTQLASAQDAKRDNSMRMTPQQRTEQRIERMDKHLKLSDEQKKQIRTYCAQFNQKKLKGENRKEEMRKLNEQIMSVLSPDQQTNYKKMQKEMRERRKARKERTAQNMKSPEENSVNLHDISTPL